MRRRDHRFFSDTGGSGTDDEGVDGLIADIAAIFHWPLPDLLALELDELLHWQRLAVSRWKLMNRPKER